MSCSDRNLYVIAPVFNPWRYNSRIKLYNEFKKYVEDSGAILYTVEISYGDREFCVTSGQKNELQLRTNDEMWHKERAINLAINNLPKDWKYLAWVDADVVFTKKDWVKETVELLQHYDVIQMFSTAIDLSPTCEAMNTHNGIIYSYDKGAMQSGRHRYSQYHPGFAWAATKYFVNSVGGLFDTSILGAGDRFMAMSLIDKFKDSYPNGLSDGYVEQLELWNDRCQKYINRNVGHMPGTLLHYWHGKKIDRKYKDRWQILIEHKYDPEFDIKPDWQGLWQYTDREAQLRYDIRKYFAQRNEDSIDI